MRILILPLLLCVGCSIQPNITYIQTAPTQPRKISKTVCIDRAFDDEDRLSIKNAIDAWKTALNGSFDWKESVADCDWSIQSASPDNQSVMNNHSLARSNIGGAMMEIYRGRIHGQEKFRTVVLHELGHLFGSDHSLDGQGLMSAKYAVSFGAACVDASALEQVALYNGLDPYNTTPCIKE
jgi:hypothetical protein